MGVKEDIVEHIEAAESRARDERTKRDQMRGMAFAAGLRCALQIVDADRRDGNISGLRSSDEIMATVTSSGPPTITS